MRKVTFIVMVAFALVAISTTGCPGKKTVSSSEKASSSDKASNTDKGSGGTTDKGFTLTAKPGDKISIKQGAESKVTLSVVRAKDFKGAITVDLKSNKEKVKLDPAKVELDPGTTEATFKIIADADAPVGSFSISANAHSGKDTTPEIHITGEVKSKD